MNSAIGLQMWTMHRRLGSPAEYRETLRRIAEIGYRVIQVTPPSFFTDDEFLALLAENGLSADSVFAPTGQIEAQLPHAAALAARMGTQLLRTDSIPEPMRGSADGYRAFAAQLNREGRACRAAGLRLMYHFHAFEWIRFGDVRGIDILLNETDPEAVWFQPDVFWITSAGAEPSAELRRFRGRACSIHVKDYAIDPIQGKIESVPRRFAPVGQGNLNWPGILAAARDIGIERFVVEQDECAGDEFDAIRASIDALHAMGLN